MIFEQWAHLDSRKPVPRWKMVCDTHRWLGYEAQLAVAGYHITVEAQLVDLTGTARYEGQRPQLVESQMISSQRADLDELSVAEVQRLTVDSHHQHTPGAVRPKPLHRTNHIEYL